MADPKSAGTAPIDDPGSVDFFADEAVGLAWHGGVARFTFATWRFGLTPESVPLKKVAGRVAMPIAALEAFAVLLMDTIAKMKEQQATGESAGSQTIQ